jgi:hypothetical protein
MAADNPLNNGEQTKRFWRKLKAYMRMHTLCVHSGNNDKPKLSMHNTRCILTTTTTSEQLLHNGSDNMETLCGNPATKHRHSKTAADHSLTHTHTHTLTCMHTHHTQQYKNIVVQNCIPFGMPKMKTALTAYEPGSQCNEHQLYQQKRTRAEYWKQSRPINILIH